jgi:uncharacterized membrane protein YdjX (TVP38/TMEM64 family)
MPGFITLVLILIEVHLLIRSFGPLIGGILSVIACVVTLAAFFLIAVVVGWIERRGKKRSKRSVRKPNRFWCARVATPGSR